jgi:hypothetical protein
VELFQPDGDLNFERDFGQWFNDDIHGLGLSWTWGDHLDPSSSYTYDTYNHIPAILPPQTPTISDHNGNIFDPSNLSHATPIYGQSGQSTSSAFGYQPFWPIPPPQVFLPASGSTSTNPPAPSTSSAPVQTPSQPVSSELISIENLTSANEPGPSSSHQT